MSLIETEETNKFSFEPVTVHPFYTIINRSLVRQALAQFANRPANESLTIVDMACGTGLVTRLIAEEMVRQGRQVRLIGVDPSAEHLRRADRSMQEMEAEAEFIQGEADDLPNIVHNADAVFFCNAIHLVPDKLAAFQQVATILAPGGVFACNSAFYEGTYVPGTERFYRLWTRRAVGWLRKEHPEVKLSRDAKAVARQWLTPKEYTDQLKQGGFSHVQAVEEIIDVPVDGWRDLGRYWLFIEGALPGAPLTYGADALSVAVYEAGRELDMTAVPRTWLQVVATKCG